MIDYIRKYYNMPDLKRGLRVKYKNMPGKITSTYHSYLRIKLDDGKVLGCVHPKDDNLKILYT